MALTVALTSCKAPVALSHPATWAMIHLHMWYVAPWAFGDVTFNWELAATPSYNGVVTSKMHADTFGILKGSKNPDAAFEVLTYMLSAETAPKLLNIYGGMPARLSMQGDYFGNYGETNFPGKDQLGRRCRQHGLC
jgi:multiple sugar transport system substrate-binding protein